MPPLRKTFLHPSDLPPLGTPESLTLDFKGKVKESLDASNARELAKDVAAFANATGGTLLIGGYEDGGRLGTYKPIQSAEAVQVKTAYERAVRDRCSPAPVIDVRFMPYGGVAESCLVLVDVQAFPVGPVGVLWEKDGSDRAYTFPIRVGTETKWLRPEQLAMLMLPELRRIAIMLDAIPLSERGTVIVTGPRGNDPSDSWDIPMRMDDLDVPGNRLCLTYPGGNAPKALMVPLDDVRAVWKSGDQWRVSIRGHIDPNGPFVKYSPRWA